MKQKNEMFLYLGPCTVVAGIALAVATQGGGNHTLAWCIFTASTVICLCLISASVQLSRAKPMGSSFFDNWPVDLDILLSSSDDEQRILAASRMAELGSRFANYPHRDDALKVLEFLAQSNISDSLRASVIGAWTELKPKCCPHWVIELAKPGMPAYSASVARAIVAGTVTMHPDIFRDEIGRQMLSGGDSICFMVPKLEEAWENAQGSEDKEVIKKVVADIGSNSSNENSRLKNKLTDRITTRFTVAAV